MTRGWSGVRAVVLDVDGTLLDSADGIVAGFVHALRSVGVAPPSDDVLRADLGPPLATALPAMGVPVDRVPDATAAYRSYYGREGLHLARPYDGVVSMLTALAAVLPLGTATAKRTDVALATLRAHAMDGYFVVVNGFDDTHPTKAATLARTLDLMREPDPTSVVMVGDRHSDVAGGREVGARTVGVTWGYGSRAELLGAGADVLVDRPEQLVELVLG